MVHPTATVYEHFCFRMKNTQKWRGGGVDSNGEVGTKKKTEEKRREREKEKESERQRDRDKIT